jgi:hypothetical protein
MKTITLLVTAIVLGLSAHAKDSFVPSHALAAKLRFEALRAGEDASQFDYTRAQAPLTDDTRAQLRAEEEERRKARVAKLLGEYESQYEQHVADNKRTEDELINLIKALEAKIEAAEADKNKTSATESLTDSTLAKAGIGVGGLLAGLAASGFIFRTRKSLS